MSLGANNENRGEEELGANNEKREKEEEEEEEEEEDEEEEDSEFFTHHSSTLAANLQTWNNAKTVSERSDAVHIVHESLTACRGIFKAGDYFIKRAFEICVLAGARGIAGFRRGASDLDLIVDIWPIATGTRSGLRIIWPTGLRSQQAQRQALRVLQRALGGGRRKVPLVRISAFLCFWQRALNGILPWQVTAVKKLQTR